MLHVPKHNITIIVSALQVLIIQLLYLKRGKQLDVLVSY